MQWNIQPAEIWMIIGFLLIFIELIKLPGFGFIFLGLGGLTLSIVMASEKFNLGLYEQLVAFAVFTTIWCALLWKPIKKFTLKLHSDKAYKDMIDEEVVVIGDKITPGLMGQVKWSGTIMNATLTAHETRTANVGEILVIKEIMGNILICSFKE